MTDPKSGVEARLKPGTHYLYCEKCDDHIPVREIDDGEGFLVECPHCTGECFLCGCHLEHLCYGKLHRTPKFILAPRGKDRKEEG